jgi:hypothetical protein
MMKKILSATRMRSKSLCRVFILFIVMAGGCAGPTSYHPRLEGTGYSDYKIAEDHYQVSYTANSLTTRKKVAQYLIYRAAQIALESNKEYFVVLVNGDEEFTLPDYARGSASYRHHNFEHHHLWFGDSGVSSEELSAPTLKPLARYTATIDIVLYSGGEPLVEEGKVYNAREVIDVLGNAVVHP